MWGEELEVDSLVQARNGASQNNNNRDEDNTEISSNNNNEKKKNNYTPAATTTNPITVAYAISLIECTNNHKSGQSSVAGLLDASLVLRHSIHQNSVRNPSSGSKYDYHMYAIVHRNAASCAPMLEAAGFTTVVKDPPLQVSEIRGAHLKKYIHKEVCCGVDEFVKLYAYMLPGDHPVVVHLDIDFVFAKPMDAIIDVMLGATDATALSQIDLEYPSNPWPTAATTGGVEAMITRDYHSVGVPGRIAGFQAGFWVLKPSEKHFNALLGIVREGNYVDGFSRQNGWGGKGYGAFIGAMAMQGLIAYYYDMYVPGTWIELNNCRYNAMGGAVHKRGQCQNGQSQCEDCRETPMEQIRSFHYTVCRKPWLCIANRSNDPSNTFHKKHSIPVDVVKYNHCMEALKVWHSVRTDLEQELYSLTGDNNVEKGRAGEYNRDYFMGHCTEDQSKGYLRIAGGEAETLARLPELYK